MGIAEIIKKTLGLIEDAPTVLYAGIKDIEQSILAAVQQIISQFNQVQGNFTDNDTSDLVGIEQDLRNSIDQSSLQQSVDEFKINFNLLDDLTREYMAEVLEEPELNDLTELFRRTRLFKTQIIDDLDLYVLNKDVLQANVLNEIRDSIIEAVILKSSVSDLESKIRTIVVTEDGSNSKLLRHVKQVTRDALGAYHGKLQDTARVMYDLDKVNYSGAIQDNTRQFCYDFLLGVGRYEPYALAPGQYRYADMEIILELAKQCVPHHTKVYKRSGEPYMDCGDGMMENTTPENFSEKRGGYGCLHEAHYSRMTSIDKKKAKELGLI